MSSNPTQMHPVGSLEWLAKTVEPIIEPELPIVDPHYHLWGPPRSRYLHQEFAADATCGHKVVSTVFAECSEAYWKDGPEHLRPVGETEFVIGQAEANPRRTAEAPNFHEGIIGWADLSHGGLVRETFEAHIEMARGRFRGVRQSTAWDPHPDVRTTLRTPPPELLKHPSFRAGFVELASLGLTFDSWVYFHQLGDVADLARSFPETTIVVDHVGGPIGIGPYASQREEVFRQWSAGIRNVAQHPNVHIKLGGMAMRVGGFDYHLRAAPPSSEEMATAWRPYMETCIEAFGASRAMFESNFPVDQLSCSYALLWNAFKRVARGCSEDEKADLFSRTAARVYRLDLGPGTRDINRNGSN